MLLMEHAMAFWPFGSFPSAAASPQSSLITKWYSGLHLVASRVLLSGAVGSVDCLPLLKCERVLLGFMFCS